MKSGFIGLEWLIVVEGHLRREGLKDGFIDIHCTFRLRTIASHEVRDWRGKALWERVVV